MLLTRLVKTYEKTDFLFVGIELIPLMISGTLRFRIAVRSSE